MTTSTQAQQTMFQADDTYRKACMALARIESSLDWATMQARYLTLAGLPADTAQGRMRTLTASRTAQGEAVALARVALDRATRDWVGTFDASAFRE